MNGTQKYNPHVIMDEMDLSGGPTADKLLGVLLLLFGLIGTPGNILALRYFHSTGRKDLSAVLYMINCICDFVISFGHYPTTIALFMGRVPGIFNNLVFCGFWNVAFFFLQKFTIFTVMLLSVSRTVAIVLPFYKVNKFRALLSLGSYAIMLLVVEITGAIFNAKFIYLSVGPFCLLQPTPESVERVTFMLVLLVAVPSIITFISFLVSVIRLTCHEPIRGAQNHKKEASNTIAIFTGCFIFCNMPYCIMLTLENVRIHSHLPYPGPYLKNRVMFWYAWPVSCVAFIVLNSAINPVLYYMRMTAFKKWSKEDRKSRISKLQSTSSVVSTFMAHGRHSTGTAINRSGIQLSQVSSVSVDRIPSSKRRGWNSTGIIDLTKLKGEQESWSNNDSPARIRNNQGGDNNTIVKQQT